MQDHNTAKTHKFYKTTQNMRKKIKKIVLGISGSSSFELSFHFIEKLPKDIMLYVVLSKNASIACKAEKNINLTKHIMQLRTRNIEIHQHITSKLASGSFHFHACIILPTSSHTLASIANGLQNNLLTRVAAVCLKERRPLILGVREMPFSTIALNNMKELSQNGVIIAPPVPGYYSEIHSLESLHDFFIGKYFDLLHIRHNLFTRWNGN